MPKKGFVFLLLGNTSSAADTNAELGLLLVGIAAGGGVDALLAKVVVPGALLDVGDLGLELEDVLGLVGGVVDVGAQDLVTLAGALGVVGGLVEAALAVVGGAVVEAGVEVAGVVG